MNLIGKKTIFTVFILVIIFYGISRTQNLRNGPVISLNNPGFTSTLDDSYILEFGTQNVDEVLINGQKVFLDIEGNVSHEIVLFEGLNEVEIRFYDKYEREGIEKITVYKNN